MTIEHIFIAGMVAYIIVKEWLCRQHVRELEDKLLAGNFETYYSLKNKQPPPKNEIVHTGTEENPNEIPIDGMQPVPIPKEFNLQIEGEDQPRHVKLEGEL